MDQTTRPLATVIAVALLSVTAAGAAAFGLFSPVIAIGGGGPLGGALGSTATAAMVVMGLLSLVLAAAAAVAARMVHGGRSAGSAVGFTLGAILIAAPAIAASTGGWHQALFASVVLGAGIIGSLGISLPTRASP